MADAALVGARARPLSFARWLTGTLRRWRLIAAAVVLSTVAFVAAAIVLPATYRAEASFVSNMDAGLKLPSSLGSLAGLAGMGSLSGGLGGDAAESAAFYVQLLQSRELLTRLLESRFADPRTPAAADSARLVDILELKRDATPERRLELGVKQLRANLIPSGDGRTNLVSYSVDMPDAALSAAVANRVGQLVEEFNRQQRSTRARAKRVFVGAQLDEAESALRAAENRYGDFLRQNRQYAQSPTLAAEERRLERRVAEASDVALSLRREYQTARIDEVNDAPVVTTVDTAVVPQRARWPRPLPVAVLSIVTGLLVGLLAAATMTLYGEWARRNPQEAAEVRRLRPGVRRRHAAMARADGLAATDVGEGTRAGGADAATVA